MVAIMDFVGRKALGGPLSYNISGSGLCELTNQRRLSFSEGGLKGLELRRSTLDSRGSCIGQYKNNDVFCGHYKM